MKQFINKNLCFIFLIMPSLYNYCIFRYVAVINALFLDQLFIFLTFPI